MEGDGAACECEGLGSLELVTCLAPPPGDYELSVPLGMSREIVVNSEGVFLRLVSQDDFLPFVRTQQVPLSEAQLRALGVAVDSLLCGAVSQLEEASAHGSVVARDKLGRCGTLVASVKSRCQREAPRQRRAA